LLFDSLELFGFALWMALWVVVLCKDEVSLGVEDDEGLDDVEGKVHGWA